jgi:hypothetical protein
MLRSALLSALALSFTVIAQAQFQGNVFVEDSTIKAFSNNVQKSMAWAGGFSNPQFAMGDLNGDGKQDLVVYEPWYINKTRAFINVGTTGNPNYQYAPYYAVPFYDSVVSDYLKLVDYNRDGIPDMITKGLGGFTVYKGKRINGRVEFTLYKELRYNSVNGQTINCFSNSSDIPAVADMDGDGDLDFLGYNESGSIIYYFKNCQVEHNSPPDSIDICKPTNCWGSMNQGVIREFNLGIGGIYSCPTTFTYNCNKGTMHTGNAMCLVDMDGDGDMDLLDGNISFEDMQYLKNGRKEHGLPIDRDSVISQDTTWQTGGVKVHMPYWPAAFLEDIDGDGKKDLLISPHAYNVSENYKNIAFYKNMGTATIPNFVYQSDTFLVTNTLDFGSMTYPVLYDYNKDGRQDLFVGSLGYYQPDGTYRSKIAYYKNTLVSGVTRFELQTTDFMNIYAEHVGGAYPAFGDLDNDGKDDMVVGHSDGTISFYKNMAASATVQPVFQAPISLNDENGLPITPTQFVSPVIYDINKDGKPDLLVTGEYGTVNYYQNVSVATGAMKLHFVTDKLGGMSAADYTYSFATMFIGKMDNTGKEYIVLGSDKGILRRYTGFETGNTTVPYQLIDREYSHLSARERSAVTIGDVNGDDKYEMFLGSSLGGLQQFKQVLIVDPTPPTDVVRTIPVNGVCSVYPNPAADAVYLNWDRAFAGNEQVNIRMVNMTGQVVVQTSAAAIKGAVALNVAPLPAGLYTCIAQAGSNIFTRTIVIKK